MLPLLDTKAITVIFANIEDILLTNTVTHPLLLYPVLYTNLRYETFLSSLEERQKECRLYIDKIGDILQNNMPNLTVYMV